MSNDESPRFAATVLTAPSAARVTALIEWHTGLRRTSDPDHMAELERLVSAVIAECSDEVATSAPAGWKLVPTDPTPAMLTAAQFHTEHADVESPDDNEPAFKRGDPQNYRARGQAAAVYREMLRAAPTLAMPITTKGQQHENF